MSPLRRRSARLRGSTGTPRKVKQNAPSRMSSLAEGDEASNNGPPSTPATAGRPIPSREEMHPSLAQHSTAKPDSAAKLGFTDIANATTATTPSKIGINSSSFDFRFARPQPTLGPEAQKMMDELREEALRIKAKLAAEREEENRFAALDGSNNLQGRKIAQPKGKVGRFSDIHMVEFKKMDSIAGHASAFRAYPGRMAAPTSSLKRSKSKAKLDEEEERPVSQQSRNAPQPSRLENTAPTKRARHFDHADTSTARPVSRDTQIPTASASRPVSRETHIPAPSTPGLTRSRTLQSLTTPTQASLARAASTKQASQIPSLTRSPSKASGMVRSSTTNSLASVAKSESSHKFFDASGKLNRMRSMLQRPSAKLQKQTLTAESSAPVRLSEAPSKMNVDKALPSRPGTPNGLSRSKSVKNMNFTPTTVNKNAATVQYSPSPLKSGIPRSKSNFQLEAVKYPKLNTAAASDVDYPSLSSVRALPEPPQQAPVVSPPPTSVPGTFTFRSDKTINFGNSPTGFGASPGQSSIRQVRPSIFPSQMPGSFPDSNKENKTKGEMLPPISHGMSNKKRRRVSSDDEEDEEEKQQSTAKRHKPAAEGAMLMAPRLMAEKMAPSSKIPSPAKRKILSMSRLNALARPKMRR